MPKRLVGVVCLLFILLIMAGCAKNNTQVSPQAARTLTDSTGYAVKLPAKPQSIVSLSIGTDELLTGLVPLERIAALTYLADDSAISNIADKARQVPRKIKANAETVISLKPDLVLAPNWLPAELVQIIREAGIAVYVYQSPDNVEAVKQTVAELAGVVGEEQAGSRIVEAMNTELSQVEAKLRQLPAEQKKVVIQFTVMGGSGGKGSTFDDLCRYAGVKNGAALAGLNANEVLSKEQIVGVNPDILLLPAWDYGGKTDLQKYRAEVQNDPALQPIKAVKQHQLIQVPDRYLFASSQYIVDGVRELAKAAYPDLF